MGDSKYGKYVFSTPTWIPKEQNVAAIAKSEAKKHGLTKTHCWVTPERLPDCKMVLFTIGFYDDPKPNPFLEFHAHPEDEILFFMGSNAEDPTDLGGEVALLWVRRGRKSASPRPQQCTYHLMCLISPSTRR